MAKYNYMTINNTTGDVTLNLREVKLILRVLEGALKNNTNITSWSAEVDLYNELSEAYKQQLDALAADLEYHQKYSLPTETGGDIVRARDEQTKGEAA